MYILYRCCRGVGGTTTLRLRKTKSRTSRKKTTGIAQDRVSYVQRKPLKRMPSLQLIVICLSFAWIRISLKKIKSLCVQESKKRPVVSEFLSVFFQQCVLWGSSWSSSRRFWPGISHGGPFVPRRKPISWAQTRRPWRKSHHRTNKNFIWNRWVRSFVFLNYEFFFFGACLLFWFNILTPKSIWNSWIPGDSKWLLGIRRHGQREVLVEES